MTENTQIVTVLTGDLVNSTALGAEKVEMAFERLKEVAKDLEAWHGGSLLFTRHRGDGWQVVLREPKYALRSVVSLRAAVKAIGPEFDTYIGVATGPVISIKSQNLNTYNDEVFASSGSALEAAKGDGTSVRTYSFDTAEEFTTMVLADFMTSTWTPIQSRTVLPMISLLNPPTYSELAKRLNKSRQAVTKSLNGLGFEHLTMAIFQSEFPHD